MEGYQFTTQDFVLALLTGLFLAGIFLPPILHNLRQRRGGSPRSAPSKSHDLGAAPPPAVPTPSAREQVGDVQAGQVVNNPPRPRVP